MYVYIAAITNSKISDLFFLAIVKPELALWAGSQQLCAVYNLDAWNQKWVIPKMTEGQALVKYFTKVVRRSFSSLLDICLMGFAGLAFGIRNCFN